MWLINTHNGIRSKGIRPIEIEDYPAVKEHLDTYWKRIEKRDDQGSTPYNLRNCAYMEEFSKQKIAWKAVGKNLTFSFVEPDLFITAPASFITSSYNALILSFLQSDYGRYFIYKNSDTTGAGDIMLNIQSLEKILIPFRPDLQNNFNILLSKNPINEKEINELIYNIFDFTVEEIEFIENVVC